MQVEAKIEAPAALVNREIDYELWLVHDQADGTRLTRHRTTRAPHGQRTEFWFAPLEWQLPGPDCTLSLTVRGELSGRLTPDGMVDLRVSHTTELRLRDDHEVATARRGDGSRTIAGLAPGETVEVKMPQAIGRAATGRCDPVAFDEFFTGHSLALRISAEPLPSQ